MSNNSLTLKSHDGKTFSAFSIFNCPLFGLLLFSIDKEFFALPTTNGIFDSSPKNELKYFFEPFAVFPLAPSERGSIALFHNKKNC